MKYFTFLLLFTSLTAWPQTASEYNAKQDWQVFTDDGWVKYQNQQSKAIHFTIGNKFLASTLVIIDKRPFSVFIDGKLLASGKDTLRMNVDTLHTYAGDRLISIYQDQPIYALKTILLTPQLQPDEFENPARARNFFSDFVIIASFLLVGFIVILYRINPRLTFDYLNIIKLFSIQERDESIVAGRIGSSVNLLFFGFISFLLALLLLIVFRMAPDRIWLAGEFIFDSTEGVFLDWFIISVIIFAMLMTKLILIVSFSLLFRLRDTVRFQFFNFIRLLFIVSITLCMLAVAYFIIQTQQPGPFYFLFILATVFIGIGTLFLYLKLLARTALPVFHLFSYLCATEIIPLLILGKWILL